MMLYDSLNCSVENIEPLLNCEQMSVVENVLSSLVDPVESILREEVTVIESKSRPRLSGRSTEQTWEMRALMIAFHLHPNLGGGDFDVFDNVFGHAVRPETMRSWLQKENIYKWIDFVLVASNGNVFRIVTESKRYIFDVGDDARTMSDKILSKFVSAVAMISSKYKQKQLVVRSSSISEQQTSAMAKSDKTKIVINNETQRLPAAVSQVSMNLGRPVKYPKHIMFAQNMIISRFEHGDPATFEKIIALLCREFLCSEKFKEFQIVIQTDHSLLVWLRRLLDLIRYSDLPDSAIGLVEHRTGHRLQNSNVCRGEQDR